MLIETTPTAHDQGRLIDRRTADQITRVAEDGIPPERGPIEPGGREVEHLNVAELFPPEREA